LQFKIKLCPTRDTDLNAARVNELTAVEKHGGAIWWASVRMACLVMLRVTEQRYWIHIGSTAECNYF